MEAEGAAGETAEAETRQGDGTAVRACLRPQWGGHSLPSACQWKVSEHWAVLKATSHGSAPSVHLLSSHGLLRVWREEQEHSVADREGEGLGSQNSTCLNVLSLFQCHRD